MPAVETRVAAVTVYADRALVTRRGEVVLGAGAHELVIDDVPLGLVEDSVRAAARASVPARIGGTDVRWRVHAEPVDELVRSLHARLEDLQGRELALERDTASLKDRERFVESFGETAGPQLARQVTRGQAQLTLGADIDAFIAERGAALRTKAGELAQRRRELHKEREAIEAELARVGEGRPTQRRQVAVGLEMEAEGRLDLDVRYQVGDASWRPAYDLRLEESDGGGATLGIAYHALVTQRTGEAWGGVSLTLSTARPALGLTVPELDPWYIAPRPQPRALAPPQAAAAAGAPRTMAMELRPGEVSEGVTFDAAVSVASVESASGSVTFHIAGGADIPSDGSPHRVTIGDWSFAATLDHVTAPKLAEHAYRRVRTRNGSDAVLLQGKAQVIVGGEVAGSTTLETSAPGQELEVYCGVDDRIHVERELIAGAVDKRTLRDIVVLTYAYQSTITNLAPTAQTIIVRDAAPLPGHEQVKVHDVVFTPKPASLDDLGRAEWELRIEPQQKAEVRVSFVIEHPRDLAVVVPPRF